MTRPPGSGSRRWPPWEAPRATALVLAGLCAASGPAIADSTIALTAHQVVVKRLGPDVLSRSMVLPVDEANQIRIKITSDLSALATSIDGPHGEVINEGTVGSYGGDFFVLAGATATQESPIIVPWLAFGYHYVYTIPSLGAGLYTVHVTAPPALAEDAVVLIEAMLDSALVAGLFATTEVVPVGTPAVLSAAVFEGPAPVTGASVQASVQPPVGGGFAVTLLDDGGDADAGDGDGIYSGSFIPATPGTYHVVATITGGSGQGQAFSRTAGAEVEVVPVGARLTGGLTDAGADDNANTLYDRLVVTAGIEVIEAGDYGVSVALRTPAGIALSALTRGHFETGVQQVGVNFLAPAIRAPGEDGPYVMTDVQLLAYGPSGDRPVDQRLGLDQPTQPYLLAQFERPAIELTGANSDQTVDTDFDGDFDLLEVSLGISVSVPGTYRYQAQLADPCGHVIEYASGTIDFPTGASPEALVLAFPGSVIGANGVKGPYVVDSLFLSGPGGSLSGVRGGATQAYAAGVFDGFMGSPDCDGNGTEDLCELAQGTSQDCNSNLLPDACDIASGRSEDCNGNGRPDECDQPAGRYPPPSEAEDLCGDAQPVCPGLYGGKTTAALEDGSASCGSESADVWYSYRPAQNGTLVASLCESTYNTVLSVHTGCPGGPANEVACNDNFCGHGSLVTLDVTAGTTYYIRVSGLTTSSRGSFVLSIEGPDCNLNDCNDNGIMDACEVGPGGSQDCNGNGRPDECDPDCNLNTVADDCDIAGGTSQDCNANAIPDECDIAGANSADCDGNGRPDECQPDCNQNGIADPCDIASGTTPDCDANGVPDSCQPDCNLNGVADVCDLAGGTSPDCNANGRPDDCEMVEGPPPTSVARDLCQSAQPVCPGIVYTGSTTAAGNDGVADCGSSETSPDVWYRFRPARDGSLALSLCGSSYDTVLSVHEGCPGSETNEVACNDDSCDLGSQVTLDVVAGRTYYIRVSGYSEDAGDFTLAVAGPECLRHDCNANGSLDECDIAGGASTDCNTNLQPDECDLEGGTSIDCDGNGIPDECLGIPSLAVERPAPLTARLVWGLLPAATGYDIVRGRLALLRSGLGDFTQATEACLGNDAGPAPIDDPATPPNGDGFWYVVRGGNCSQTGTYDSGDASQVGSRDAEIQASPLACP